MDNGAILYERQGGAPVHTDYQYIILDFYGNEIYNIGFSKYDAFDDGTNKDIARYYIDNVEVSKDAWNALTKRYFSIKSDLIQWKDISDIK